MTKHFDSAEFNRSFNKQRKLLREHFGITEAETQDSADAASRFQTHDKQDAARDVHGRVQSDNITYLTKEAKGEVTKIIAELRGKHSAAFTVAINKWEAMAKLQSDIEQLEAEIKQEGIREKIAALFGAEYEFVTRVVQTVNLSEIAMSKQPEAAITTEWSKVWKELSTQLTPELLKVGEEIIKKYSTIQKPKPPSIKYTPAPVTEGLGEIWKSFLGKIKSWGRIFDSKLENVKDKIQNL